jgi:hypothetical protein
MSSIRLLERQASGFGSLQDFRPRGGLVEDLAGSLKDFGVSHPAQPLIRSASHAP